MIGKTLILVASSKDRNLALRTQEYLDAFGAETLVVAAAGEARSLLRARRDLHGIVVVGDAALTSRELLGWLRAFRPHLPCCVIATERRHLVACAAASGHFLMRERSELEIGRVALFLREQLNH